MGEEPVKLVISSMVSCIIIAIGYIFLGTVWSSGLALDPGNPMYESMVAITEGAIASFGLLGVAGTIGFVAWMVSQAQSI